MSLTDCKICGGRRFHDRHDIPSCEACEPMLAAHLISMRTDGGDAVAVCPCGWSTRHAWTRDGRSGREAAVIEHLRSAREASL